MDKLRLTVVTPLFPTSAERYRGIYIYNTVRGLQRHADVDVVCTLLSFPALRFVRPISMRYNRVDLDFAPSQVNVRYLEYPGFPLISRPINSMVCRYVIEPHIKSLEPDVILAYWAQPEGNAAIKIGRRLNVPVIVGALGSDLLLARGIGRHLAKQAVAKADRVLTVSEALRTTAISLGASPSHVRTIRNGCDRSIFFQRDRASSRAKLGIDPGVRLVLFVGWLAPLKGVMDLVAAFPQVRQEFANAELVCIGEGPLQQFLRSSGVTTLGPKTSDEVADWLGACDVLCLPSHSEGCPNVVVEALSSGRPVIATHVGGIPELVDCNSAILVSPGSPSELGSAIAKGLKRSWDENAIAARTGRSWDDVADDTYAACLEVVSERRSPAPRNLSRVMSRPPTTKPKIAIVTPLFPTIEEPYRGSAIYKTALALQQFANVEVLCPQMTVPRVPFLYPKSLRYRANIAAVSAVSDVSVRYIPYPAFRFLSRPINAYRCMKRIEPFIDDVNPDLVLAYWIYPEGRAAAAIARKRGVPVIVGARGSDLRRIPDIVTRGLVKSTIKDADFAVTVSEELRKRAIELGCAPSRVQAILNGCDPDIFFVRSRIEARQALNLPEDVQLILFVGWLAPLKGLTELFEAVSRLIPQHPRLQLACIGEGRLANSLNEQCSRDPLNKRVRMLGARSSQEISIWLGAADLLCLPSHSEGCPNVILEALACGRPVVASDVGGIPELLNASSGILVPPADVKRLAEALHQALELPWDPDAIALRAARDWDQVAEETFGVCQLVLSENDVRNGRYI
jgi:teichuronic acid biosynthesis glycosyltransferase TuaC